MKDDIKYIYNNLATLFNEFSKDLDIQKYETKAAELCRKYKDNNLMLNFCQNLIVSWTPVINQMKYVSGDK